MAVGINIASNEGSIAAGTTGNIISGNTIDFGDAPGAGYAIAAQYHEAVTITGNTIISNYGGILISGIKAHANGAFSCQVLGVTQPYCVNNHVVTGNTVTLAKITAHRPIAALWLQQTDGTTVTGNDFSGQRDPGSNWGAITTHNSDDNTVYNNNFHDNTNQVGSDSLSTGNVFTSTDSTIGGNWWDTWDGIADDCIVVGNFCDPLILPGGIGTDFQPWTSAFSIGAAPSDANPPVVSVPADITEEATSGAGADVSFSTSAEDDVDGPISASCTPLSGSTFPLGDTTVNCTVTDQAGNEGAASFTVSVEDTTGPALTIPADGTEEATGELTSVSIGTATATDLVDANPVITNDAPAAFPLGATDVEWTATDDSGNSTSATQVVTVEDTTPPEITDVTADPSDLWPVNNKMKSVTVTVVATDAIASPNCSISSVTNNETGDADAEQTGDLTVDLKASRSGNGSGRVYTITVECTDGTNVSEGEVDVTVPHDQGNGKAKGRNK